MGMIKWLGGWSLLFACGLLAVSHAGAEEVAFTSASPYQLGDLMKDPSPAYELRISADLVYPRERKPAMPATPTVSTHSRPSLSIVCAVCT